MVKHSSSSSSSSSSFASLPGLLSSRFFLAPFLMAASLGASSFIGGCSGSDTNSARPACVEGAAAATAIRAVSLPDLTSLGAVNCGTGAIDSVKARMIYDAFFDPRMPKNDADFQWASAPPPNMLSKDLVERVQFPAVYGETVANYHALFSFDPSTFARPVAAAAHTSNFDLFATFASGASADPREAYKRVNALDYIPTSLTHYARVESNTTDIMATQFVFRMACDTAKMEAALAVCPDCVDTFAPLSRDDIGRVLEVRFARTSDGTSAGLQVSKPLRIIGVDSSGAIATHATAAPFQFLKVDGVTLRARWRGELSGKMAHLLGTYGGPTPALMRAASFTTNAETPDSGAADASSASDAAPSLAPPPPPQPAETPPSSSPECDPKRAL